MENTTSAYINMSNASINHTEDEVTDWMSEGAVRVPIIIFQCIIVITGVIGNGYVCYIYMSNRGVHFSGYFVSLAIFDFLSAGVAVIIELILNMNDFKPPYLSSIIFNVMLTFATCWCLVIVTVESFNNVFTKPQVCDFCRRSLVSCIFYVVVWVWAIGLIIIACKGADLGLSSTTNNDTFLESGDLKSKNSLIGINFWNLICGIVVFIGALIPNCAMGCLIARKLFQQSEEAGRIYEDEVLETSLLGTIMERSKESIKLRAIAKKQTIIMVVVSVAYIVCCVPGFVSMMILVIWANYLNEMSQGVIIFLLLLHESFKLNYIIKPVIYLKCDHHFRKECRRILPGMFNKCVRKLCRRSKSSL